MNDSPKLFVSIFAYVLGKETDNPETAVAREIELGERASWPAFRTLARIRAQRYPVHLKVTHSSLIAKARSLAMGNFLESGAPRWISIDDDVDASADDVAKLLLAEDIDILLAPCAVRGAAPAQLNVAVETLADVRVRETGGVRVFPVLHGGFACSAMSRFAAEKLDRDYTDLRFVESSALGLGVFLEQVRDGAWWGEDFSCCTRARASGLRIDALCDSAVTHAGLTAVVNPSLFTPRREN